MTKINVADGVMPIPLVKSTHVYRQICATLAAALMTISVGLTFGFTAVLLPELKEDHNFSYDKSFDSWIASISPLAMIIGCLFSGSMSDAIGRRMGQIILIFPFIIGWTIMGFASNNILILVARFITGVCSGAVRPNTVVYIGELTDPKYRQMALFCISAATHLGILISHTIGSYVHWKTSCFLFTIPNIISLILLMFVKESPLWLLSKEKIDKGIESFRSFRGSTKGSEEELAKVLGKCKEKNEKSSYKEIMNITLSKPFIKSLVTIIFLFTAVQWSGINTLSFYTEDIFEQTFSGSIDSFKLMIAMDCLKLFTVLVMCIMAKKLPRKLTLLASCFVTSIILIALVAYLYVNPPGLVWLAVLFVTVYITVASPLSVISWTFVAELFPTKVRGFASGLSSAISFALLFSSVKVTPGIIDRFGDPAIYAVFAIITLVVGVFLIFLLPDINGKSLQDIEDLLYKKKNIKSKTDAVEAKV